MIGRLIDKVVFGTALLIALQVPQLVDHYQQFLSGLYQSTKWQIEGYQATADDYGYQSVELMIEHHLTNPTASVRADAQQKRLTLARYDELEAGVELFESGHLLEKFFYLLRPARYDQLAQTLTNFTPGIPLGLGELSFGFVLALILHLMVMLPMSLLAKRLFKPKRPRLQI
ncbi:DUF2937 family protein [Vibrio sp. WXL103]|uniref:DUF2937 family protein n=1 Tax=unclassified Vibrio TaxID=2614977 RepID=UPI003EC81170